ncbi:MAG: hypothetical protein RR506_07305 [Akkermansia sp.]
MKASLGQLTNKETYSAYCGDKPLKSIYIGQTKIFPTNAKRISRLTLDMTPLQNSLRGTYWTLALKAITQTANDNRFIKITCGRTYCVDHTYKTLAIAYYLDNGIFSFANDQGPLANKLKTGDNVTIRIVIPRSESLHIGGTNENQPAVSYTFPPCIPGTELHGYCTKGRKRTSSGLHLLAQSLPSGKTLIDHHNQRNGHCRCHCDWTYARLNYINSETGLLITARQNTSFGPWGAYLLYPPIDQTLTLKILKIQTSS